jgi:hypothetical protein
VTVDRPGHRDGDPAGAETPVLQRELAAWDPAARLAPLGEAEKRITLARAQAALAPSRGSLRARTWTRPAAGAAAAAALLALLALVPWLSSRSAPDSQPQRAPAHEPERLAERGVAPAGARPTQVEEPADDIAPPGVAVSSSELTAVAVASPDPRPARAEDRRPRQTGALPAPGTVATTATITEPRRIRRLTFEAPSGTRIHWILDSGFEGLGGHAADGVER